jgi:hypothetical protein
MSETVATETLFVGRLRAVQPLLVPQFGEHALDLYVTAVGPLGESLPKGHDRAVLPSRFEHHSSSVVATAHPPVLEAYPGRALLCGLVPLPTWRPTGVVGGVSCARTPVLSRRPSGGSVLRRWEQVRDSRASLPGKGLANHLLTNGAGLTGFDGTSRHDGGQWFRLRMRFPGRGDTHRHGRFLTETQTAACNTRRGAELKKASVSPIQNCERTDGPGDELRFPVARSFAAVAGPRNWGPASFLGAGSLRGDDELPRAVHREDVQEGQLHAVARGGVDRDRAGLAQVSLCAL